jgi:hypothetical protein
MADSLLSASPVLLGILAQGCFGSMGASPATPDYAAQQRAVAAAYRDPSFDRSKEELEPFLARALQGYSPEGGPAQGQLESFQPVDLSMKRGRCYMMVLRLGPGARWSDHARSGVVFQYVPTTGAVVSGGPGIHGPGGAGSGGCPQATTPARFDLIANFGSATDKSRIHELGQGPYTLQLHSKPISEDALAAQAADQERQLSESREFQRQEDTRKQQRIQGGCALCQQKYSECIADWRRGASRQTCANEHRSCVFRETNLPGPDHCPR